VKEERMRGGVPCIVKEERMPGGVPCIVMGKAAVSPLILRMSEEERKPVPSKGWAA